MLSAEAREVYEEGLFIPIMKLYEGGRLNESLVAMIRAQRARRPSSSWATSTPRSAGGAVGGERLLEFMDEFGLESLEPLADEIISRTERAMREAIGALRPGHVPLQPITSDGFDEPITIACPLRGAAATICWSTTPAPRRPAAAASTW